MNDDRKIGFITAGDGDYVDPKTNEFIDAAVKNLGKRGVRLAVAKQTVLREKEAEGICKAMLGEDIDGAIIFLGCWAQCNEVMAIVREIEHLPFLIWGVPMFMNEQGEEDGTGAFVSYAMVKGPLNRLGYTYSSAMGMPDDEQALEDVVRFCKCAVATERLKRTRIGKVGGFSVGIWTGAYDHVFLRGMIGPNVREFDSYSIIRRAEAFSEEECVGAIEALKAKAKIGSLVTEQHLLTVARLYKSLKSFCDEYSLQAMTVKCQYEFSKEYGMTMCVPLSMLSADGIVASCESDVPCVVTQVMFHYLTGQEIGYGDAFNTRDNTIKLSACGFTPFGVAREGAAKIEKMTRFEAGFKGVNDRFVYRPGRITFARLVEGCGDYKMVVSTGEGIETKIRQGCMPALDVIPDGSLKGIMDNFNGQHYAIGYGDITGDLSSLCAMLGIEFVRI